MVDRLYFSNQWLIRYIDDWRVLYQLIDIAKMLRCEVRLTPIDPESDTDFAYLLFVLSVHHLNVFHDFTKYCAILEGMKSEDWLPSTSETFDSAYDFDFRQHTPEFFADPPNPIGTWDSYSQRNEVLLDREEYEGTEQIYVGLDWLVSDHSLPANFSSLPGIALNLDCSFYYLEAATYINSNKMNCYVLRFGLRSPDKKRVQDFMIKAIELGIKNMTWHYLSLDKFYNNRSMKLSLYGDKWYQKTYFQILPTSMYMNNRECDCFKV